MDDGAAATSEKLSSSESNNISSNDPSSFRVQELVNTSLTMIGGRKSSVAPAATKKNNHSVNGSSGLHLRTLLDYLSEHLKVLVSLEPTAVFVLDELTRHCMDEGEKIEEIFISHGWSLDHGWMTPFADFENLFHELGNIYLKRFNVFGLKDPSWMKSSLNKAQMEAVSLLSFCPDVLVNKIHSKFNVLEQPVVMEGALFIADISGFSRFSSEMCRNGASGLDAIFNATNDLLGSFIDVVYSSHGDVVFFAGDALVCVFSDTATVSSNGCCNAIICADRLLDFLRRSSVCEKYGLSAHFGVVSGKINFAVLGGLDNKRLFLMNGVCFSELSTCLDASKAEETVCTRRCLERAMEDIGMHGYTLVAEPCTEHPEGEEGGEGGGFLKVQLSRTLRPNDADMEIDMDLLLGSGMESVLSTDLDATQLEEKRLDAKIRARASLKTWIVNPATVESSIEHFIPKPVIAAVGSGTLAHMAEFRKVTVVFLKLDNFSFVTHSDPASLGPFVDLLQARLKDAGGYLRQFVVDDKGCVAVAFWGVPHFTYPTNTSRGVYFAASMVMLANKIGYKCSAGVTTGQVYCGVIGSIIRRDYVCIGDKVNLAARLMGKAKGRVLVDKETFKLVTRRERRWLLPAEELHLKGQLVALRPFAYVSSELPTLLKDSQLFGSHTMLRSAVIETLLAYLDPPAPPRGQQIPPTTHQQHQNGEVTYSEIKSTMVVGNMHNKSNKATKFIKTPPAQSQPGMRLVVVLGMKGSGKCTAARIFHDGAVKRKMRCVHVLMKRGDEHVPFAMIRKIFAELIRSECHPDKKSRRQFIRGVISRMSEPGKQEEILASVEEVLDLSLDDGLSAGRMAVATASGTKSGANKKTSSFAAFTSLFTSARQSHVIELLVFLCRLERYGYQRMALVIENAQCVDVPSWSYFDMLRSRGVQLSVLITLRSQFKHMSSSGSSRIAALGSGDPAQRMGENGRSDHDRHASLVARFSQALARNSAVRPIETESELEEFQRRYGLPSAPCPALMSCITDANTTIQELTSFSPLDIQSLLSKAFGPENVTERLTNLVTQVSSGNAYWCKVIIRQIQANGVEEFFHSLQGQSQDAAEMDPAGAVKLLIMNRMDALTAEQQLVLKYASAIGAEFTESLLGHILPSGIKDDIFVIMEALLENDFVFCLSAEDLDLVTYGFENELIRNMVHSTLPLSERAPVHERIAVRLEMDNPTPSLAVMEQLVCHYEEVPHARHFAFKFSVLAADYAASQSNYPLVHQWAEKADTFCVQPAEVKKLVEILNVVIFDLTERIDSRTKSMWDTTREVFCRGCKGRFDVSDEHLPEHLLSAEQRVRVEFQEYKRAVLMRPRTRRISVGNRVVGARNETDKETLVSEVPRGHSAGKGPLMTPSEGGGLLVRVGDKNDGKSGRGSGGGGGDDVIGDDDEKPSDSRGESEKPIDTTGESENHSRPLVEGEGDLKADHVAVAIPTHATLSPSPSVDTQVHAQSPKVILASSNKGDETSMSSKAQVTKRTTSLSMTLRSLPSSTAPPRGGSGSRSGSGSGSGSGPISHGWSRMDTMSGSDERKVREEGRSVEGRVDKAEEEEAVLPWDTPYVESRIRVVRS